MKAAAIYWGAEMPQYTEFAGPIIENEDQLLISVRAAAIKHLDKSKASGRLYSAATDKQNAKLIGGDGVGLLQDGTRAFGLGVTGMIEEKQ